MRLQGWVLLFSKVSPCFLSASWRQKHTCVLSQAAAIMAEEAKKLAAYAAVDNHVQVE